MNVDETLNRDLLRRLEKRRRKIIEKLKDTRERFLEVRARKNYLEMQFKNINDDIEMIKQGQLVFEGVE